MVSLMIYIVYAYIHCIKSYFVQHYALKPPNLMGKRRKASNITITVKLKCYIMIINTLPIKNITLET